jgi:spore maturation protein CgeB
MKDKLLFIPLDWKVKAQPDWYLSLSKQFDCYYFNDNILEYDFKCDYIWVQCGAIDKNILNQLKVKTGAKIIQWTGNCNGGVLEEVLIYKGIADVTLLASGLGQKNLYQALLGHHVGYLQHGMAEFNFVPVNESMESKNIVFIGNNYDQFPGAVERNELCLWLSKTFENFEVIGNGYSTGGYNNTRSCSYYDCPKIYNESYIAVAANCMNDIEGYWSNRCLDIMAAGCACLMRYTPNAEKWFTNWHDCVFYETKEEAVKHINTLLNNKTLRNTIAVNGQKLIRTAHSLDYRAIELRNELDLLFQYK